MLKKNNKGFTLLELLIAITTVIFIGYKVIDKVTIDSKNQGNINRGRLTMNNINEYLTKDLEQTTSIEFRIYVDWEADTKLEEENSKIEILNRLLGNKSFTYEYKLRFNDDNKYSIYKVNIDKSTNDTRYTLSLFASKRSKIDFINNEILSVKEVPFAITWSKPYRVTMGHNDKDNKFNVFEFDVVSRIEQSILEYENDSNQEEPVDSTGDIVYEFTKNEGKVDMSMKINAESQNNTGQVGNGYTQNSDYNVTALIKTDEGSINISGMGEIGFKDPKFK